MEKSTKEYRKDLSHDLNLFRSGRFGEKGRDLAEALLAKEKETEEYKEARKEHLKEIELKNEYEKVKKICENVYAVKNDEGERLLVNIAGEELLKGIKFESIYKNKKNNYMLEILNKMYEAVIEDGELVLREYTTRKMANIAEIKMILKEKEIENDLMKMYRKVEKSKIYNGIHYVKLSGNPLWYIVLGNGEMADIKGFIEYEERSDGLRVKRRDGKGFTPNWYLIKGKDLVTHKDDEISIEGVQEREDAYKEVIRSKTGDFYLAQKKGRLGKRVILDNNGEEVEEIGEFEKFKYIDDGGEVLAVEIKTNKGSKWFEVHQDPRELVGNVYIDDDM